MGGLSAERGLYHLSASLACAGVECLPTPKIADRNIPHVQLLPEREVHSSYVRESAHHPLCRHGILFSSICSLVSYVHWTKEEYVRPRGMHINHLVQAQTQSYSQSLQIICKVWQARWA